MCKILEISRETYYYHMNRKKDDRFEEKIITRHIIYIFNKNRKNYGTRRIKVELEKFGYQVSRRRISRIMKENNLVSNYTVKNFKPTNSKINEANIENIVNREFKNRNSLEVLVSDLTYVRIKDKWGYICTIEDLFNRDIIGYSRGIKKDAELVKSTFDSLDELLMGLAEYVYYYNNIRLHSSLGYMTPVEYRKNMLC